MAETLGDNSPCLGPCSLTLINAAKTHPNWFSLFSFPLLKCKLHHQQVCMLIRGLLSCRFPYGELETILRGQKVCRCLTHCIFFYICPLFVYSKRLKIAKAICCSSLLFVHEHIHTALCRDMETLNFKIVSKGFMSLFIL